MRLAAYECARWCAVKLLKKPTLKIIEIEIELSQLMRKNDGILGYCSYMDSHYRPREFLIEIEQRVNSKMMLTSICHEMVHVKQYVKKEMQDIFKKGSRILWKGNEINFNRKYEFLPWEKEAKEMEYKLYHKMIEEGVCAQYTWRRNHLIRKNFLPDNIY